MYDVVYLDRTQHGRLLASGLGKDSAMTVARSEARRLRVGRMFLAGSDTALGRDVVVIVPSTQRRAA
jgi:hypothetical protein